MAGIRVLDLSRVLAAPWCTQILGDLGAEVVKVERPGSGDETRGWGPPFLVGTDGNATGESAYYLGVNRNKRSITVDLAHAEGQAIIRDLAAHADVLVENFKVGDLARHGLGYETLRVINPQLVFCSVTGFGQSGPYADRAGYDFAIQAIGGLMSLTGEVDGQPGGGPQKVGVAVADLFTGMYAAVAILAALRHRDRDGFRRGPGQAIDMALLDAQVAMTANLASAFLVGGQVPGRIGNAHHSIVPYQVFAVADGQLVIAVGNDRQFAALCEVLGLAPLALDSRFARNADRVRHRDLLIPLLAARLSLRTRATLLEELEAATIPCGSINRLDEVFADRQVGARGMLEHVAHPLAPFLPLVASPLRLLGTPATTRRPPPLLGEHTDDVLRDWLGWDHARIERARHDRAL